MLFTLEKPAISFQTIWMDTSSPTQYWTQICQLPSTHNPAWPLSKNADLSVSYTNCQTPSPTTVATNLQLHINSSSNHDAHRLSQHLFPPPSIVPSPQRYLQSLSQSLLLYCWRRPRCSGRKSSLIFVSPLYVLAVLTCGPVNAIVCLGKCRFVTPSIFVCFMPFQVVHIILH